VQIGATLRRPLLGLFRIGLDDDAAGRLISSSAAATAAAATPLPRSLALVKTQPIR
jgi:hypothetical protein